MSETVLNISNRYKTRSEMARRERRWKNNENWQAYRGQQNWSHKAEFQSRETTPGFPLAVDQIVGTFERALTDSDEWLLAETPGAGAPFLPPETIEGLTKFYLERLWQPGNHAETGYGIQVLVADAVKNGMLEPMIVAKVWPVLVKRRNYRFKVAKPRDDVGEFPAYELVGKELEAVDVDTMRIAIEIIGWDDYFPDPSPACRYEIHRTRRQLHELLANPDYDQDVVRSLLGAATEEMTKRGQNLSAGERSSRPDPYEIEVYEGWGDIIDEHTGEMLYQNVFWAWCNQEIIRKPTQNPFWDGTRPFIVAPILRIRGSKEPKALADHAVPMWRAANELFNLILDGSMRAAWGVSQVRPDVMESPEEIADGIPQGYTAVLKPNLPLTTKFYERVDNGEVPQMAVLGLQQAEGYVSTALATPETSLGQVPEKAVKATEIVQALKASGSLFEAFAARFEDTFLEPLFQKVWKLILQYVDSFLEDELVAILGARKTLQLEGLSAGERFKLLHKTTFKVRGLRGLAAKEREFTKLMTLVNLLGSNQQFADHFGQTYDYSKLWERLIRASGNDPTMLELDEDEEEDSDLPPESQNLPPESGSAGGQLDPNLAGSSGASAPNLANVPSPEAAQGGESSMAAQTNPNTGPGGLG